MMQSKTRLLCVFFVCMLSSFGCMTQIVPSVPHSFTLAAPTSVDINTGLIWQMEDDGRERIWAEALSYCKGLTLAGRSDWRLPTYEELASIIDITRKNPSINTKYFPETKSAGYWTSYNSSINKEAASIYFDYGTFGAHAISDRGYVRCVRGTPKK